MPRISIYLDKAKEARLQADFDIVHTAITAALAECAANGNYPIHAVHPVDSPNGVVLHGNQNIFNLNGYNNGSYIVNPTGYVEFFSILEETFPKGKQLYISSSFRDFEIEKSPLVKRWYGMPREDLSVMNANFGSNSGFYFYTIDNMDYKITVHSNTNDNNPNTYGVSFVYKLKTGIIDHIVLSNDGYVSVDGGKIIKR